MQCLPLAESWGGRDTVLHEFKMIYDIKTYIRFTEIELCPMQDEIPNIQP